MPDLDLVLAPDWCDEPPWAGIERGILGTTLAALREGLLAGWAGRLLHSDEAASRRLSDPFVLLHGPCLARIDAGRLALPKGGAELVVHLQPSDSGTPVLTDPRGVITSTVCEGMTNLRDSGVWTVRAGSAGLLGAASPRAALRGARSALAELLPGRTRTVRRADDFLLLCNEVQNGLYPCGVPGVLHGGLLPEGTSVTGTCWVHDSVVGDGCRLENVVIIGGSRIGRGCRIRNALLDGARVPPDSDLWDRALKVIGG